MDWDVVVNRRTRLGLIQDAGLTSNAPRGERKYNADAKISNGNPGRGSVCVQYKFLLLVRKKWDGRGDDQIQLQPENSVFFGLKIALDLRGVGV